MIDCHCHLADREFENDIDEVVNRAKSASVVGCLINTEGCDEFQRALDLSQKYHGFLFPCFGIHPVQYEPTEQDKFNARSARFEDIGEMETWVEKHHQKLIALGEVGLDHTPRYLKSETCKDSQKAVLLRQIDIALKYDLPLISHSRSAGKHVIAFMLENGVRNLLLHAFDGNAASARPGIAAGYFFSIPPSVVRSEQKKKLIKEVPLGQLLLETDSPVLGPVPDERNEPKNIQIGAEEIAKIKGVDVVEVVRQTTENALRLFPKLKTYFPVK